MFMFLNGATAMGSAVAALLFLRFWRESGDRLFLAFSSAFLIFAVNYGVLGLVPLAMHGGPLWEPMCYAQMGGMMVATFITLLLVPVIYSIFVLDLKLIKWDAPAAAEPARAELTTAEFHYSH